MFDLLCIPESFVIKHRELRNLNPSAYQLQVMIGAMIGVDIEHKEAKEKGDIKIDRSRDLEDQILEMLVIIAKRKAIGSSIVLN